MLLRRPAVTLLLVTLAAASLGAELKITAQVNVKKIRQPDAFVRLVFGPVHRITAGKVDVTTYVAGDRVRVEGLGPVIGLAGDVVLISRADGTTRFVQPSTRTFFIQNDRTAVEELAPVLGTTVKTSRKGPSDVILSQRTERVFHEIRLRPTAEPADGLGTTIDEFGRSVPVWTLNQTAEERQQFALRRSYLARHDGRHDVVRIESWESTAFGPAGRTVAAAGASPAAIGSAGFSRLADLGFPLRQILTYPSGGYRIETRVTSVTAESVAENLFDVPAGFVEVPAPSSLVTKGH